MTTAAPALRIEFCGEWVDVPDDRPFGLGRDAELLLDENPYLHRRFIELSWVGGFWCLANVGTRLAATVADADGAIQAWVAPGARMPIVFASTAVRFTAGPTSYEVNLHLESPVFEAVVGTRTTTGVTTLGQVQLNADQRLLVLALAEPALRRGGRGTYELPSSAEAAERLGWPLTTFNRKLDYLCQKLKQAGVQGLHGDEDRAATARRARLVEWALALRLITIADLADLPAPDRAAAR